MTRLPGRLLLSLLLGASALPVLAEPVTLAPVAVTEWKAVYGTVEARDRSPARARIGGVLVELSVVEGDEVARRLVWHGEILPRHPRRHPCPMSMTRAARSGPKDRF